MADPCAPTAAAWLAARPIQSGDLGGYLALSTTSAATANALPAGYYAIALDKSGGICMIAWASTVAVPTSGADLAAGAVPVRDGDVIKAPGGSKLAAILTGSGTTGSLGYVQLQAG